MNKSRIMVGFIGLILFLTISCVTFEQQVLLGPVTNDFPVSASSSIYWNGRVYTPDDYNVINVFEYMAILESPVSGTDTLVMDFSDDLAAVMSDSGADGIVDFSFQLVNIQKTPLTLMDISQTVLGMGLATLGSGIYFQLADNADMLAVLIGGASASALGLGGYFYIRATGTVTYVYTVTGTLVSFQI